MTTTFLTDKKQADSLTSTGCWLFSPAFDLLFVCGGAVLLLFGAHLLALAGGHGSRQLEFLATMQVMGTLLFSQTHTISSYFLVGELEPKGKLMARLGAVAFLALGVVAIASPFSAVLPGILAKLYLFVVPHHFLSQSYGFFKIYCLKADYIISPQINRLLKLIAGLTTAYWCSTLLTAQPVTEVFLLQALPAWDILPIQISRTLLEVLILLCTYFVARLALDFTRGERLPPFASLVLLSFSVLLFLVPQFIQDSIWLYAPAYLHGSQYLALLYKRLAYQSKTIAVLTLVQSLLIGAVVFLAIPYLLTLLGVAYGAALAVIFVVLQFQHVLVDGLAWRLSSLKTELCQ